ncbi:TIGR03943 family protein [Candidatus Peregrinibacteria bacterium]|nr:TIGR03943 family protein [Candidatus Peregrinibacteria bacterium]
MKERLGKNIGLIALVFLYAYMVLKIFFSGKSTFYIHPDFTLAVLVCGLFFALLAFLLVVSLGTKKSWGADSHSVMTNYGKLLLVVLPVALFLIFPAKPLSSQAFLARSIDSTQNQVFSRRVVQTPEFIINTENRSLIDWIRLFSQSNDYASFTSLKARLTGFVLKDESLPDGYFTLARFVISCCAADARPIGLIVKYDSNLYNLSPDQWLEVRGEFAVEEINGQNKPVLILKDAKTIEIPDNPYIS